MKKYFIPVLLAASMMMVGCKKSSPEKSLVKIDASGYKTEYTVGDPYDPTGLKVTATYSDDSTANVPAKDYTVTGFDSSSAGNKTLTVTYQEKTTSFTIRVSEYVPPVDVKVNIKLSVTVSGLPDYLDLEDYESTAEHKYLSHSKIWFSSSLLGSSTSWGTQICEQNADNPNLWTIEIDDKAIVGQTYDYNFYYGDATEPDWDYGCNELASGTSRSLPIVENQTDYAIDSSFALKEVKEIKNFTLALTPHIQPTSSSSETFNEGIFVYAYSKNTKSTSKLTPVGDTWTIELPVIILSDSGEGKIHFTAVLSNSGSATSATDWDLYKMGQWNGSTWEAWNNGDEIVVNSDSDIEQSADVYFKSQPEAIKVDYTLNVSASWNEKEATERADLYVYGAKALVKDGIHINEWWYASKMTYDSVEDQYSFSVSDVAPGSYEFAVVAVEHDKTVTDASSIGWNISTEQGTGNFSVTLGEDDLEEYKQLSWLEEPGYVDPDGFDVTFKVYLDNSEGVTGLGIKYKEADKWVDSGSYEDLTYDTEISAWTVTVHSDKSDFYFAFSAWGSDWSDARIETSTEWAGWHLTVTDETVKTATVEINASDVADTGHYVGSINASTNCTVVE